MEVMVGERLMKPLRALVVEVGGVLLCQLLSQEQEGGGQRSSFVVCHLLFVLNDDALVMLDAVFLCCGQHRRGSSYHKNNYF